MSVQLLYVATGFFVGLLVGQTGMGGGSLVTPSSCLRVAIMDGAGLVSEAKQVRRQRKRGRSCGPWSPLWRG